MKGQNVISQQFFLHSKLFSRKPKVFPKVFRIFAASY